MQEYLSDQVRNQRINNEECFEIKPSIQTEGLGVFARKGIPQPLTFVGMYPGKEIEADSLSTLPIQLLLRKLRYLHQPYHEDPGKLRTFSKSMSY